jgi:hypothetical protein
VPLRPGGGAPPRGTAGENPPYGASIFYLLPEDLEGDGKQEVKLEILDADGKALRTLSSQKEEPTAPNPFLRFFPELAKPHKLEAKKGLNRFDWNLQLADAFVVQDAVLWGTTDGPVVPPGRYQVRMTLGDWTSTQQLAVVADPRREIPAADYAAQFALARDTWELLSRTHRAIQKLREVRTQVDGLAKRLKDAGLGDDIATAAKELTGKLDAIEQKLHQPKSQASQDILNFPPQLDDQIANLLGIVGTAAGAPTQSSHERFAELRQQLDRQLGDLDAVLTTDLPAFEKLLREKNAPPVVVPKEAVETPSHR